VASVKKTIEVSAPIREVYNQWTQFESFPHFMEGVEEVRQLDDKRLHWRAKVGGKEEEWDAEITEQIPDARIAWRSTSGRPNAGVVDFHRLSDGQTQVSLQLDAEPQGVVEKVGDALGVLDRQVQGDLERFRDYISERGTATGAWRGEVDPPHRS
jgi:uncharacterized membrane protein